MFPISVANISTLCQEPLINHTKEKFRKAWKSGTKVNQLPTWKTDFKCAFKMTTLILEDETKTSSQNFVAEKLFL